jgi:hypothetical protein
MAILRVDHPDIEEFVDSKRDQQSILNFNISVGVTDAFMRAVLRRLCHSASVRSGASVVSPKVVWLMPSPPWQRAQLFE